MYDVTTILIGPSLPVDQDTVGLAFVSAPVLPSDVSVAVLSAERYVTENYPHLANNVIYTATQACSGVAYVNYSGTAMNGLTDQEGGFNFSYTFSLEQGEDLLLPSLVSPIRLKGLHVSKANSWYPIVEGGVVWRSHTVDSKEVDPTLAITDTNQPSWLVRSGLIPGDTVFLIYSVPEIKYGSRATYTGNSFPGSGTICAPIVEQVQIATPHQLKYDGDLTYISSIVVNGVSKFPTVENTTYDGTTEDSYITGIDKRLKIISVAGSLTPEDVVLVTYYSYANHYNYSGFRDFSGNWYCLDCNPEYGHLINDPELGYAQSATHLLKAVTLYAMPSAYVKVETNRDPSNLSYVEINISFESAYNWSETHFIRHTVGLAEEGISARQQDGPANTWGKAVFGRNYYDEEVFLSDDIFSNTLPSMMPLGRAILTAPASIKSVAVADIRQRGGGVPEDFPFEAIDTQADGLDTLRGYYDLGNWDGPAHSAGGVAEIRIDSAVLDRFSKEEVYKYVESQMLPGVDFQISFVPTADL